MLLFVPLKPLTIDFGIFLVADTVPFQKKYYISIHLFVSKQIFMETIFTREQKKEMVDKLIQEIAEKSEELKIALEDRDILLFRSFRMAHPELFHEEKPEIPICIDSIKEAFREYLLKLSKMGFLTYYLD